MPGTPWDMGHRDDDPTRYAGPEHRRCSRATAARRQVVVVLALPDAPERGVFWGPPNSEGKQQRWSRPWTDWREVA